MKKHHTRRTLRPLLAATILLAALPVTAQDFYVIKAGNNFLAHTNATTIGNATSFNATTCLWTISGSNIIAISPDGTKGYYLSYVSGNYYGLSLRNDGNYINWTSGISDGGEPVYNTNYYLRYRNSAWGVSNNNTHGVLTKLSVTTAANTSSSSSTSYGATVDGDGVIYSTSGNHTYTASVNQIVTYSQTTLTFGSYPTTANIDRPFPVSSAYTGSLTGVTWSVSENSYGATITSGGVLTLTSLPAVVDYITVTYTATAGGQTVTASQRVMLAHDQATAEGAVGQPTSVTTTTVTLNDYEPHEWAYYNKELNSPIHSWNPANVKISYYGYGAKYTTQSNGNPSGNLTAITSSNALVRVGSLNGETQHTFVYYKTLERTDGQTAADPSGRCEYRTIPNPFSVRPRITHADAGGTGNSATNYTGFYMWRLKTCTGGSVYTVATGGTALTPGTSTVDAEQVLYFAPTSEYGMTVEFEAIWAPAYVTGTRSASNHNAYERNFYIGAPGSTALNYAATISAIYPDGTNGSNTTLLTTVPDVTQTSNYSCSYDTKFEYIKINATRFTAGNNYLILGRGITGTITHMLGFYLNSANNNTYSNDIDKCSYRLESGTINNLNLLHAYTGNYGSGSTTYSNPVSNIRCTIGCDYDRAGNDGNGDNTLLSIAPNGIIYGANRGAVFNSSNMRNTLTFDWCVKSGKIHSEQAINDDETFYLGTRGSDDAGVKYCGKRRLTIEGGEMNVISAGLNSYGPTSNAQAANRYTTYVVNDGSWSTMIRIMKGNAKIRSSIYGAAVYAGACGDRRFVLTGGEVGGWIAGGCNGTQTTGGELYGSTEIYHGGNAKCDSKNTSTKIGSSTGGNIFGAGSGIEGGSTVGQVFNSTIVIADEGEVERDVYGGGNYGYVNAGTGHGSDIYILGGTVQGKVFGGSNQQQGQKVNITMTGGQVVGGVYGGSNASGTVAGPVSVSIEGGTVGEAGIDPTSSETGHVFGSGYGSGTSVTGNVTVNIGKSTSSHSDWPLIHGNVYGGGHAAPYTSTGKTFQVLGQNGLVKGSVFGGGKGATATVTGPTDVQLQGYINVEGNVFGGGDAATVTGNTSVTIKD